MWSVASSILGNIFGIGKGYLEKKQELKQIEKEGEIAIKQAEVAAKIQRIQNNDTADNNLDALSLKDRGLKDDYLLLVTTMPMVLLFVGPLFTIEKGADLTAAVMAGFDALNHCPDYYWLALAVIYIDTFGLRRMFRGIVAKKFGV